MIADWHYERPDQTPVYFAMKGFRVATSTWNRPAVAEDQWSDMLRFRKHSNDVLKDKFLGVIQTVWSGAGAFMDGFYENRLDKDGGENTPWHSFVRIYGQ